MVRRTGGLLLAMLLAAGAARSDIVERRGVEPAVAGRISLIDQAGVTLRTEMGAVHFVPWDRVRRVEMDDPSVRLKQYLPVAEDLWRARSRLERGDAPLAEPLFERLFERYRGATHETALVVAEGLLRCRLSRGAYALAVVPALETARLVRANVRTDSYSMLPRVLDETTGLCTRLAPVWVPSRSVEVLQRHLAEYDAQGDEVIAALAALYRQAAEQQLGLDDSGALERPPNHPGVALLALLVDCLRDDEVRRRSARERLIRRLPSAPPWEEAWSRFHVGLSQLRERGRGRQQEGLVSLLHVPARFAGRQKYLAGLALAVASECMQQQGDAGAARSLRDELDGRFASHPVHDAIARGERITDISHPHEEQP